MKSLLLQSALTLAVVAASWGFSGTTRVAQADQVLRSARSDAAQAANWRGRRWYGHPYIGPYWDGGGYYGPYSSPQLYYRRIAPGVYYYF